MSFFLPFSHTLPQGLAEWFVLAMTLNRQSKAVSALVMKKSIIANLRNAFQSFYPFESEFIAYCLRLSKGAIKDNGLVYDYVACFTQLS